MSRCPRLTATETFACEPGSGDDDSDRLIAQVGRRLGSLVQEFRVVFYGDGLVLRGRARSYYAKLLAQHAVMKMTALRIVANEITVVPDCTREGGACADA
jgi:hypothetical protein